MNLVELKKIAKTVLLFSPFNTYGYTDHSERHAERVEGLITNLWTMINNFFPTSNIVTNPSYDFLSQQNKEKLIASAWLHDIGNVVGRVIHQKHTYDILMDNNLGHKWQTPFLWSRVGMTTTDRENIAKICQAHRRPRHEPALADYFVDIVNNTVYCHDPIVQFDSAILLIADALDITADRSPSEVYELLPFFWKKYPETHAFGIEHWEEYRVTQPPTFSSIKPEITVLAVDLKKIPKIISNLKDEFIYVNSVFLSQGIKFDVIARDWYGNKDTIW